MLRFLVAAAAFACACGAETESIQACDASLPWSYRDFAAWNAIGMCGHSQDQSPIDIVDSETTPSTQPAGALELTYIEDAEPVYLFVNEHTYQVNFNRSPIQDKVTWNGKDFFLTQFHYHSPSENTLNGEHFDMELHHVNVAADGQILVVAVWARASEHGENSYMAPFWGEVPRHQGQDHGLPMASPYHSEVIFPGRKDYYYWQGSLTTPPCTNDTVWIMMKEPMTVSFEQVRNYREGINGHECTQLAVSNNHPHGVVVPWDTSLGTNNRPVQALASRVVYNAAASVRFTARADSNENVVIMVGVAVVGVLLTAFVVRRFRNKSSSAREGLAGREEYVLLAA